MCCSSDRSSPDRFFSYVLLYHTLQLKEGVFSLWLYFSACPGRQKEGKKKHHLLMFLEIFSQIGVMGDDLARFVVLSSGCDFF